ncbi:probable pectate lyase 4 [Tanacetum coccineum]|uniref:Probable pectate lyase 4 n=1 Tax=Tanacetum coccineum TaxID=301880 RepID=A0ABQ5J8X8_9ASTR
MAVVLVVTYSHVDSSLRALAGQAEGFGRQAVGGLHGEILMARSQMGRKFRMSVLNAYILLRVCINYNCYLHPVGLRHGISEHLHPVGLHHVILEHYFLAFKSKPLDLPFGSNFTLSPRDELFDMEVVSRIFEEDIDIVNEVQCHIKNGSDMALPSTLYLLAKDGYNPQCDIDFEEGCNLKHFVLEILVTHEMDEAYLVIDEAPQSNIHAEVKSTCYSDHSDSEMTGLDHLEPHVEKKEPVWIVFEVLGSIKLASYLNVSSYKTIDGQGQRSKFTSKGLRLKECEHVIVCNLEFKGGRGRDVDAIKIKRNSK